MKKILFALICQLGSSLLSTAYTQSLYNAWYYNYDWVWELGTGAGIMNCLTDLGGQKGNGGKFIKDLNWNLSHPCFSLFATTTYKDILAFRIELQTGTVSGADSVLSSSRRDPHSRYARNLSFRSRIREILLIAETHPLFWNRSEETTIPALSPYIGTGISYFAFNPQAQLNNKWIDLHPLRLEGQGFDSNERQPYSLKQIAVPLLAGLRYETGPLLNIRLEITYRILFTDYLDDVSTTYINPTLFATHLDPPAADLARQLYHRMGERQPGRSPSPGQARGNPDNNDAFFSIQLKLAYSFRRKVK